MKVSHPELRLHHRNSRDVLHETDPGRLPPHGSFLGGHGWKQLRVTLNFEVFDADGTKGEAIYLEDGLGGLPSGDVAAGAMQQGVIAFDIKNGPTTVVINDDFGDKAATFTLTPAN